MKKLLLFLLVMTIGLASYSQKTYTLRPGVKVTKVETMQPQKEGMDFENRSQAAVPVKAPQNVVKSGDSHIVSVVNIGGAANIYTYGYYNGTATYVWYNKDLNAVSNLHRMGGPVGPPGQYSGDLCYDISMDGGMTWTNQIKIYESNISGGQYNTDAARYPQGAIYNPAGNTDPANAYMAFFAANLDGTNGGSWGGYSYGVGNLADPEDTTKHLSSSDLGNGFYQGIPTAFTITRGDGVAVMADASLLDSYTEYLGDLIFYRGEFDDDLEDYVYQKFLHPAPAEYARYLKIGFDPTGQTGYVFWNNADGSYPMVEGWDYPLLVKSTDGGQTWSDVIAVELSGPDGIDGIKNWLSDELIAEIWEAPVPTRDEIMYTSLWWNSNIAVDAWGNPHLGTSVHVCGPGLDPGFILVGEGTFAMFNIYSIDDDNEDWHAIHLGDNKTYRGEFGDLTEMNRVDVTSSWDGTKIFFTWLDTHVPGVTTNVSPDIFARGFDVVENAITYDDAPTAYDGATNVTYLSEAMWQSYFKSAAHYSIDEGEAGNMTYTIPLVYADFDPADPGSPVQFKYIQDFSFADGDFTLPTGNPPITGVGITEPAYQSIISVSQNYPNPFNRNSTVMVNLEKKSNLRLVVSNILGQQIQEIKRGEVQSGTHHFIIDGSNLGSGIYFYTVFAGKESVTRKMVIE